MKKRDARLLSPGAQEDLRRRVAGAVLAGMSQSEASRVFGVSRQAVNGWMGKVGGDVGVGLALGGPEHDLGASDQGMRQGTGIGYHRKLFPFFRRKRKHWLWSSSWHEYPPLCSKRVYYRPNSYAAYLWDITLEVVS